MASFDELKKLLISRLYEEANKPYSSEAFLEEQILELLFDQTGIGIAKQAIYELLGEGLLRQTSVADGSDSARFEITGQLIRLAEQLQPAPTVEKTLSFTGFRDDLIVALYHKSDEQGLKLFSLFDLAKERKIPFREGWIFEVCNFLDDQDYALVTKVSGGDKNQDAQLTANGLEYAENLLDQIHDKSAQDVVPSSNRIPNVDGAKGYDYWEPLKIDRGTREYERAIEAVEEALGVIEGDNGYASSMPEEREQNVWSIKEGLRAIREILPSYAQVQSMVLHPLMFLSKKFAETAMGVMAKKAVGYLFTWLASIL